MIGELCVPRLALGTIAWTPERSGSAAQSFRPGDAMDSKAGTTHAQRDLARAAMRSGARFFDTAERYSVGEGERLLARAVESQEAASGRPCVMATKFTPAPWRLGPESVVQAAEASRERLGVACIDLYQIHMPDVVQPGRFVGFVRDKDEEYWEGLARVVELGIAREVGVSNYGPTRLRRCHEFLRRRGVRLASNQIHYSLLARRSGGNQATVDCARELGVQTLAYYPLAMGLLTQNGAKRTGALEHYARGGTGYIGAPWQAHSRVEVPAGGVAPLTAALSAVGERRGKTVSQVALNWIIGSGVIPIAGATTEAYVLDAAGALGWRLSDAERAHLEQVADDLDFEFQGTFFKRVDSKFVGYGVERWELD